MLTQARLKEVLYYDPETGVFTWLKPTSNKSRVKIGRRAGSPQYSGRVGTLYWKIYIDHRTYKASRLAWLYVKGNFPGPDKQIDHHNRDSLDDRWANLRLATHSQNQANRSIRRDNRSGSPGVFQVGSRWRALISINSHNQHIGYFDSRAKAYAAYLAAASEAYGEFARTA